MLYSKKDKNFNYLIIKREGEPLFLLLLALVLTMHYIFQNNTLVNIKNSLLSSLERIILLTNIIIL